MGVRNSSVGVRLEADTEKFEAKIKAASDKLGTMVAKGTEIGYAMDASFKKITIASNQFVGDVGKAFGLLNIQTDLAIEEEARMANELATKFKAAYHKMAADADASTGEVTRAFVAMNEAIRVISEQPLKSNFSALGIMPTSEIEAQKASLIRSYEELAAVRGKDHEDTIRAYEAMVTKLIQLDKLHLTESERNQEEAFLINEKFNKAKIELDKQAYDAKIAAERANLLSYEAAENEAFLINEKFNANRVRLSKESSDKELADLNLLIKYKQQIYESDVASKKEAIMANLRLVQETNSIEQGMSKIRNDAVLAAQKQRAESQKAYELSHDYSKVMEKVSTDTHKSAEGMNLFNLASAAAIIKIQVLYSLVNTVMSAIGRLPGDLMSSVDDYRTSVVSSAALITSMQKSDRDLGERYKENKEYAEAVVQGYIEMDAHTAASGKNLIQMNEQLQYAGVYIDFNIKKQVEGALALSQALALVARASNNPDQQYPQETGALMRGENRTGNRLFQQLNNQDNGHLKKDIELWQQEAKEQKNAGLVLEKMLPLLQGYKAAQGDIDALWSTIKTTLITIYKETLREGFGPEFDIIVKKMKELGEYATENKTKIANMMKVGFEDINSAIGFLVKYNDEIINFVEVVTLAKIAQYAYNTAIKANPYVMAATALVVLDGSLKHVNLGFGEVDMSLTSLPKKANEFGISVQKMLGNLDESGNKITKVQLLKNEINSLTESLYTGSTAGKHWWQFVLFPDKAGEADRINATILKIKELQKEVDGLNAEGKGPSATKKFPAVPEGLSGRGKDQAEIDKELEEQRNLRNKIAELEKSKQAIILAAAANGYKNVLQLATNSHEAMELSDHQYLLAKQKDEDIADQAALVANQETVKAREVAMDGLYRSGVKGTIEQKEAEIKLNEAKLAVNNSIEKIDLNLRKHEGERQAYYRQEEEFIKSVELAHAEMIGDWVGAEKIRQTMIAATTERIKLENLARERGTEAVEAQAMAIDLKNKKEAQEKFKKYTDDTNAIVGPAQERMSTIGGGGLVTDQFNASVLHDTNAEKIRSEYEWLAKKKEMTMEELAVTKNLTKEEMAERDKMNKANHDNDQHYQDQRLAMEFDVGLQIAGIIQGMAGDNKAAQYAALAIEKSIAMTKVIINSEVAKSAALANHQGSELLAAADIATITTMEYVSIGLIAAQGAISAGQISARANGGPVEAGKTYLVNENRKTEGPEYFTPGVNGVITPARKMTEALTSGSYTTALSGANKSGDVTINVVNNANGTQATATERGGAGGSKIIDILIEQITGKMAGQIGKGQGLAPLLEGRYGLNPAYGMVR